eukprot:m51a1_g2997 putative alpha-L-fucosidase (295) ;mRNA; r:763879-766194
MVQQVLSMLLLALLALSPGARAVVRVTCVGDSITEGYPWSDGRAWPAVAQTLLGSGYSLLNSGVSGTTMQSAADNPWVRSYKYSPALASSPDIVVIMMGTNDAKSYNWNEQRYRTDYAALIAKFRALPSSPKVYVAVSPPLFKQMWEMNMTVINKVFPRIVPEIARAAGATPLTGVYDLFGGAALTRSDLINDGCHPNAEGYKAIAQYMAGVISGSAVVPGAASSSVEPAAASSSRHVVPTETSSGSKQTASTASRHSQAGSGHRASSHRTPGDDSFAGSAPRATSGPQDRPPA